MDPKWLISLIADAELVADASLRLKNTTQSSLLSAISSARLATDDAAREIAYRTLQTSLPEALREIAPVTIFELQQSWVLHQGFRSKKLQLYSFWILSIILMVLVGYTTSLYNRASEAVETLASFKDVRLAEQGARLFNMAKQHRDVILKEETGNEQTLASDNFFRALTDLQSTQNRISAVIAVTSQISGEMQFLTRIGYGLCWTLDMIGSVSGGSRFCRAVIGFVPPVRPDEAVSTTGPNRPLPLLRFGAGSANSLTSDAKLMELLDRIDQFLDDIGAGQVKTRYSVFLLDYVIRDIKGLLEALRAWILPAAYGSLGAAIFFTRRFFDPMQPNPDPLRVIYRILFGGFAGIIFAWFWTPSMNTGLVGTVGSPSAFGIAFLAGYGTDIFFQLLDRMVQAATQQIRGKPDDK